MGKFDDLVPNLKRGPIEAVKQNDFAASDLNPDTEAEVLKLSKEFKTPTPFVRDNVEDFKKQAQAPKYGDLLQNNPKLTKFLAKDVSNLAVSKDSLPELQGLEKRRNQLTTADSFPKQLGEAYFSGSNSLATSALLLGGAYGLADVDAISEAASKSFAASKSIQAKRPNYVKEFETVFEQEGRDVEKAAKKFFGTNYYAELSSGNIRNVLDGFKSGGQTVAETLDLLKEVVKRPKALAYSMAEQFPNSAPAITAGLASAKVGGVAGTPFGPAGATVGGGVGFLAGSFAGSYYTEVGSWIQQKMQERNLDLSKPEDIKAALSDAKFMQEARAEAERKGLGTAGVDLLFNTVAGGLLAKVGRGAGKLKKVGAAVADVGVQAVGEGAGEAAGQYAATGKVDTISVLQESFLSLGQSVADTAIGSALRTAPETEIQAPPVEGGQIIEEAPKAPATPVYTQIDDPIAATEKLVDGAEKAQKVIHDVAVLQDLGKMVRDSKLYQRIPEKMEELLEDYGDGNEAKSVFFQASDWDNYFNSQGLSPVKAAQDLLGGDAKAYFQSKQDGSNFEVPLSKFLTKTATAENFDSLLNITRTSPNGLTITEARQVNKELPNLLAEVAVAAEVQAEKQKAIEIETNEIKKEVKQQLAQGGIFDSEQTNAAAETIASLYRTEQNDVYEGKSVAEIYKENPVRLEYFNKVPEGMQGFEQRTVNLAKKNKELLANTKKLKDEGFSFWESQDLVFDENGEEISGPKKGKEGYAFTVFVQDKTGNDIGQASFIIKDGELVPNDFDGDREAVNVDPAFRRKGIATELYRLASAHVNKPVSNKNWQTESGKALRDALRETAPSIFFQADKQKTVRGFFDPLTKLVGLLKNDANISTPLHEILGHMWLERMGENVDYLNTLKQTQELTFKQKDYLKRAADVLEFLEAKSFKDITPKQHEKWAAHYEAYLMEGKAPSERLKSTFEKFKIWFVSIYKDILGLERDRKIKINLSDKLRNVFDRLLATEEEIAKAQSNYTPLVTDPIQAGMSKDLANKWYKVSSEASEAASTLAREPVMKDYLKKQEKLYKDESKKVREELANGMEQLPDHKALKAIESDPMVKDLPIEIQAEMYGYESVLEFEQAMDRARDQRATLDSQVEAEMNRRYPDSLFDLEESAIEAVHNDKQAEKLRIEAEFLAEKMNDKALAARLIARLPSSKILKEEAARRIGEKAVKDIKPYVFERAERAASREAAQAFKQIEGKGVEETQELLGKAFDAKRKELLNHEMYKAAIAAQKQVEKKIRDYKKLFKKNEDLAKNRDIDYVNAARAVAANYGITRAEKTAEEYLDKLRKYEPARYEGLMNIINTASDGAGLYKEVSFAKFETMTRAVDALWSLSRSTELQTIEGQKIERDVVVTDLTTGSKLVRSKKGFKQKYDSTKDDNGAFKTFGLKLKAALTRIEAWVDYMDNGKIDGPFRKYFWNPISQANVNYDLKKNEVLKTFRDALRDYAKDMSKKEIVATELIGTDGRPFLFQSKFELLMAVLHTGNDSNKSKLLRGYGWGAELDGVLDTSKWDNFLSRMIKEGVLTKDDFDFAQRVWDLTESFKGDLQRTHKELEGYFFEEVTAKSFEVVFADGSKVTYQGGYIPAKVDTNKVKDFKKLEEIEIFEKNNPSFAFPTTGMGATKTRNEAFARRLSLDLNLLGAHIDWALRYTYFEPRVQEVSRLINDQRMKDLLQEIDPEIKGALESWLQRTAQQTIMVPSTNTLIRSLEPAAKYFRTSAAMQVMFGNISNTLQQVTGLVVAMTKVKPRYIAQGFTTWLTGFGRESNKAVDDMIAKSKYMETIQGINVYEVQNAITELIANPNKYEKAQEWALKHTYILQTAAQNIVNTSTWWGAYNQAIAQKMSEKQAVAFADSTVRQTQGTNKAIDVAAFEVGSPVYRMFIQFAGYFNMLANLNASEMGKVINEVGIRKGGGRLFYTYMMGFMLPAVLSELIVKGLAGKGFDEDDDDEYLDDFLAMFAGSQFKTATAMVPAVGQFAVAKYNRAFTDNMYDDRLNMSLAISTIDQITDFPINLYKDLEDGSVDAGRTTKDFMTLIGVMTKTPVGLPAKQVKYLIDVSEGKVEPSGSFDFTRGLITGKGERQ